MKRGKYGWRVEEARQKIDVHRTGLLKRADNLYTIQKQLAFYRTERTARLALHALKAVKKRTRGTTVHTKKTKWLEVAPALFLLRSLRDRYLKLAPSCSITIEQDHYVIHHQTGYAKFVLTTTLPRGEEAEPFTQLPLAA